MNELVQSIMTTQITTLGPNDSLGEARDILLKKGIHHLPIVDGAKLVGLITSWDIFKLGKSAEEYHSMSCKSIMSTKLATLEPDHHIGAIAEVLMTHAVHAVPIINDNHELMGIVTTYDLLKYEFSKEYPDNLEKFVPENM